MINMILFCMKFLAGRSYDAPITNTQRIKISRIYELMNYVYELIISHEVYLYNMSVEPLCKFLDERDNFHKAIINLMTNSANKKHM